MSTVDPNQMILGEEFAGFQVSDLERRFAVAYVNGIDSAGHPLTQKAALLQAGYRGTPETADSYASQIRAKPVVTQLIAMLERKKVQEIKITQDDVLGDLQILLHQEMGRTPVPVDIKHNDGEVTHVLAAKRNPTNARAILELLGRHFGMWTDRVEMTKTPYDDMSEDDLQAQLESLEEDVKTTEPETKTDPGDSTTEGAESAET